MRKRVVYVITTILLLVALVQSMIFWLATKIMAEMLKDKGVRRSDITNEYVKECLTRSLCKKTFNKLHK